MKRNTMLAFVALMMVVIVGAGGAYWAVKKYRAKQRQEFRYEGKMGQAKEGFKSDTFKQAILSDDMLDKLIDEHQLVAVWGVEDSAAAKEVIKKKFIVKLVGSEVRVSYQDKNKELSQKMLKSIVNGYYEKVNAGKPMGQ